MRAILSGETTHYRLDICGCQALCAPSRLQRGKHKTGS